MDLSDEIKLHLKSIYYDPKNTASFGSAINLYSEAKQKFQQIKLDDIKTWLSSQRTYTLHKQVRKRFKRNKVIVTRKDEEWMCDLSDMTQLKNKNDGYIQMLTVIDTFSKYAWIVPLKDKKATTIRNAFESIFKIDNPTSIHDLTEKRCPEKLNSDKGGEFNNNVIKNMCSANSIRYFTTQNEDIKASIVERFNRTIKSKIFKYFTSNLSSPNSYRWLDIYKDLLNTYNHTYHRTIKMRPIDVNRNNEDIVFKNIYGVDSVIDLLYKDEKHTKLTVGDKVRISKYKRTFEKGYLPSWTEEIFTVRKSISKHIKPSVEVDDEQGEAIVGRLYPEEVQKVIITPETTYLIEKFLRKRTKRGKVEYLVKWFGYPESRNSWVPEEDLQDGEHNITNNNQ